jgi:hypothetical protein
VRVNVHALLRFAYLCEHMYISCSTFLEGKMQPKPKQVFFMNCQNVGCACHCVFRNAAFYLYPVFSYCIMLLILTHFANELNYYFLIQFSPSEDVC